MKVEINAAEEHKLVQQMKKEALRQCDDLVQRACATAAAGRSKTAVTDGDQSCYTTSGNQSSSSARGAASSAWHGRAAAKTPP